MSRDRTNVKTILERAKADRRFALTATDCAEICRAYEIPIPPQAQASSAPDAIKVAVEIGFPVAMKIASPDILHKTEAGGVALNLRDAAAVEAAYQSLIAKAKAYKPDAKIDGVLVQKMVPAGIELIVGASTDPSFGKLVAFGVGGVLVEVLSDITFRLAPVTLDEAHSMLDGIRSKEILTGLRGSEAVNRDALAALLQNVSRLVDDFPEIVEVDLNPVFASRSGATAADVRILASTSRRRQCGLVPRPTKYCTP